jgi:hypothetical protein
MPDATAAVIGGSQVLGGIMGSRAASKQAAAMNQQAAGQIEAARIAAEEARFRPVGITTRFGTATPQFTGGRLSGYSYEATPELQALQDQLARIYQPSLEQAERAATYQPQFEQAAKGLFSLGQQYVPQSQEQVVAEQMALLRPYDVEEEQRLAASVFGRGRGGLSVGTGGQPELQALAESRARRNERIAASAPELVASRAAQAAGLFGQGAGLLGTGYQTQQAALSPFQTQFGLAGQLEQTAQDPMQIGAALGAKTSQFGGTAGQILQGGQAAAGALQSQAAQAKAAQMAGMGAGIASLGQQYYQNQQYKDYLDVLRGSGGSGGAVQSPFNIYNVSPPR